MQVPHNLHSACFSREHTVGKQKGPQLSASCIAKDRKNVPLRTVSGGDEPRSTTIAGERYRLVYQRFARTRTRENLLAISNEPRNMVAPTLPVALKWEIVI